MYDKYLGRFSVQKFLKLGIICFIFFGIVFLGTHIQNYSSMQISLGITILMICFNLVCLFHYDLKKNIIILFIIEVCFCIGGFILKTEKAFIYAVIVSGVFHYFVSLVSYFQIKQNKKIIMRVIGIFFAGSIIFFNMCLCYNLLFLKTIQDYKSYYEIKAISSPDKNKKAILYMYEQNENDTYDIIVAIRDKQSNEKNIDVFRKKSLEIDLEWKNELLIDGRTTNVE